MLPLNFNRQDTKYMSRACDRSNSVLVFLKTSDIQIQILVLIGITVILNCTVSFLGLLIFANPLPVLKVYRLNHKTNRFCEKWENIFQEFITHKLQMISQTEVWRRRFTSFFDVSVIPCQHMKQFYCSWITHLMGKVIKGDHVALTVKNVYSESASTNKTKQSKCVNCWVMES